MQKKVNWTIFYPYAIFAALTFGVILSGRDLSRQFESLVANDLASTSQISVYFQRLVSLFLIIVTIRSIFMNYSSKSGQHKYSSFLLLSFFVFWIGTVASPAVFGWKPNLSHDYLYTLLVGWAIITMSASDSDETIIIWRNAATIFIFAGLFLIVFQPSLVIELNYSQSIIGNVPRLAGLAPHAVSLAMTTQVLLLLLIAYPFKTKRYNYFAFIILTGTLFFAQSKTAWISFAISFTYMQIIRNGERLKNWVYDVKNGRSVSLILNFLAFIIICAMIIILTFDITSFISRYFLTKEGMELSSLTGRDAIWQLSLAEWHRHPIFGYGPNFLDFDYRKMINMPYAIHAHNQLVDALARSGLIGAICTIFYTFALVWGVTKTTRITNGLAGALFIAIMMRSITEIPLVLRGYNHEFLSHSLLLAVITGGLYKIKLRDSY